MHPKVKKSLLSIVKAAIIIVAVPMLTQCNLSKGPDQQAPKGPTEFIPYAQFTADTQKAKFEDYAKRPGSKVVNEKEFQKMQKHIASLYDGVVIKNSFIMENNGHVDCIDTKSQPGLRQGGKRLTVQKPPKALIVQEEGEFQKGQPVQPMLAKEKKDRFGNRMFCENNFIPMRRVTLDELTRFRTLEDFFNKYGKAGTIGVPGAK